MRPVRSVFINVGVIVHYLVPLVPEAVSADEGSFKERTKGLKLPSGTKDNQYRGFESSLMSGPVLAALHKQHSQT